MTNIVGIVVFNLIVASILGIVVIVTLDDLRDARWRRVPNSARRERTWAKFQITGLRRGRPLPSDCHRARVTGQACKLEGSERRLWRQPCHRR